MANRGALTSSGPYRGHATTTASGAGPGAYFRLRSGRLNRDNFAATTRTRALNLDTIVGDYISLTRLAPRAISSRTIGPRTDATAALEALRDAWDTYSAPRPTRIAIQVAHRLAQIAADVGIEIDRVVPTADAGARLYFFSRSRVAGGASRRYAALVIEGDGTLLFDLHDRTGGESRVEAVPEPLSAAQQAALLYQLASFARDGDTRL